jgi:hypothetical protein
MLNPFADDNTFLERYFEPLSDDINIPQLDAKRFADVNTFLEQDVEPLSDDIIILKLEPLADDYMPQELVDDPLVMTSCF